MTTTPQDPKTYRLTATDGRTMSVEATSLTEALAAGKQAGLSACDVEYVVTMPLPTGEAVSQLLGAISERARKVAQLSQGKTTQDVGAVLNRLPWSRA